MTELHDGDELSIDIPEGSGTCFVYPDALKAEGAPDAAACKAFDWGAVEVPGAGRLIARGATLLDGGATPARFSLHFVAEAKSAEPTAEAASDFGASEAARHTPGADVDGGAGDAAALEILAVGSSPARGAASSELVTLGSVRAVRATFTLDLRESGHDTPVHFLSYGSWSREGVYVLTVEGDAAHAAAVDAFGDEAARTLVLRDPAPPAPSEMAQIGTRLAQIGVVILVTVAVVVALLGARTRRLRG
jgi:hypothetical protein